MVDQQELSFTHTLLELKLGERLDNALKFISTLSKEDVLRCDSACLTELVREFAVSPPILRSDLREVDEEIIEINDITFDRKTGTTGHIFLIPVERDAGWLEGVDSQRAPADDYPLAFLDRKRNRIRIKLMLSPEEDDDSLISKLVYRTTLVEKYVASVEAKLVEFNKHLAEQMTLELNKRKNAIVKAKKAIERTGLPRVHNPEHTERAIQIDRLIQSLGTYMTNRTQHDKEQEIRSFIVHGHDQQSLFELKDYVQNTLKLGEPVVLRQMPGLGKTLIEKFEHGAESIELVFVLLTPDDKAAALSDPDSEKRRARQNVILELGFFLGKLGRASGRVLLLHKGGVEIPSDIAGIEYINISNGIESAGERIRRELRALGILK